MGCVAEGRNITAIIHAVMPQVGERFGIERVEGLPESRADAWIHENFGANEAADLRARGKRNAQAWPRPIESSADGRGAIQFVAVHAVCYQRGRTQEDNAMVGREDFSRPRDVLPPVQRDGDLPQGLCDKQGRDQRLKALSPELKPLRVEA